jgi:hypothetical protein
VPQIDGEYIVLTPSAPLTDIMYSGAGWTGANRCTATGASLGRVPMPTSFVVPHGNGNNGAVFLEADGRTLVQTQPLTRCTAGGYATALFIRKNDIYGDGIIGAHGGSRLSSIGGSLRVGELRPGGQGPRHALKLNLYAAMLLYNCPVATECWRWPAQTADGYWSQYGDLTTNTNSAMKMGALLAIPASTNLASLNLETDPGRQLAWTLQNYGAYIVDDAYGYNYAISAADEGPGGSFIAQFQADYGYPMRFLQGPGVQSTPWARDFQKLVQALWVVNNNSPTSIGGGGTPRQPLAPPFQ